MNPVDCKILAKKLKHIKMLSLRKQLLTQKITEFQAKGYRSSQKLSCQIWNPFIWVIFTLFRLERSW